MASINDWVPKKGMEVFLVRLRGLAHGPAEKRKEKITKIAGEYFWVGEHCFHCETKYPKDTVLCGFHCFRSEDDYLYTLKIADKRRRVANSIHILSDEQIETVCEWINEKQNNYDEA